jgi:hypothetical protein
MSSFGKREPAI